MSRAAATAPPLWVHLLLTLVSLALAFFIFAAAMIGDCTFPGHDRAQQVCLDGKRVVFVLYPVLASALLIAALLVRRPWRAWSAVLTGLAPFLAVAFTILVQSVVI